jgi:predicted PurR-regulated permease PerM
MSNDSPGTVARAAVVLACLGVAAGVYFGRPFLVPITLAVVIASLLEPAVRVLRRARVPAPIAATIVLLASLAVLAGAGFAMEQALRDLATGLPKSIARGRAELTRMTAPLARIGITPFAAPRRRPAPVVTPLAAPPRAEPSPPPGEVGEPPAEAAPAPTAAATPSRGSASSSPPDVTSAAGQAFNATLAAVAEFVEVLMLTLLFLAGGDRWRRDVENAITSPERRARTLEAAMKMRAVVTRYLVVTALINAGQGLLVAIVAWRIDLPSPLLWGVLTFVAEFIPFLGGAAMVVLLLLAGLGGTGSSLHALIAPVAYLVITTLQNNVVSPVAYGRGLRLNAAMILVAVIVWYALWGIAGAFLAVPILASVRILSEYVEALAPVGVLLDA